MKILRHIVNVCIHKYMHIGQPTVISIKFEVKIILSVINYDVVTC